MLLNDGTLDGVRILSPQAVSTLLAQVWRYDGKNGATDSGFYCSAGNGTHQLPHLIPGCADDMAERWDIMRAGAGLTEDPDVVAHCEVPSCANSGWQKLKSLGTWATTLSWIGRMPSGFAMVTI